ncbi:hypothetical protein POTOM_011644 [Populus tomentosa]|uniref:Signal peptidase complex catalytic subunit SEC11 n=2 Tax=rosids TaxID=71275 RepID=A0A8X8A840_POPTO|nr:hypothetical protein POTOM_011644 [Populus tomentosa]
MGWIGDTVDSVKSIQIRQLLTQAVSLARQAVMILRRVWTLIGNCCFAKHIQFSIREETAVLENSYLVSGFILSARISVVLRHLLLVPGMIVTSALIIWKALMCITGSESPVVVVLSGSMEPGFKRGDILFLHMSKDPIRAGEIVVFNVDGREIPIVHRVIKVHERQDTGEVDVLTKGDNNYGDDRLLYAQGQLWLQRHHIMGRAVGFLPYVGWVTIIMTEKPIIKYILIGALGLLVITSKD